MPDRTPELDQVYDQWRREPSGEGLRQVIEAADPQIRQTVQAAGARPDAVNLGMGRRLVVDAAKKFDPEKETRFSSWVRTQLQPLGRQLRARSHGVRIPDHDAREGARIRQHIDQLTAQTGFEPSDAQISDELGIPLERLRRLRAGQPRVSDEVEEAEPTDPTLTAAEAVYHSVGPKDQLIMEKLMGFNQGQLDQDQPVRAQQVASDLGISSSAVSQRQARLRRRIEELSRR